MLFVTLLRGRAGKQRTYLKTLDFLRLYKPRQEVGVPNNAANRGQIEKVRAPYVLAPSHGPVWSRPVGFKGPARGPPSSAAPRGAVRVPRFFTLMGHLICVPRRAETSPPLPAQVKHLVSVETAQQRTERLAALEKKLAWRPPLEIKH